MLKEKAQSLARENPIIGNCEECEYEDNLIRHHDDYNNPMDIRILCRKCHAIWHKNNKAINGETRSSGNHITLRTRVDKKLKKQLQRYADRNDEGNVSVSARRALRLLLKLEQ